MARFGVYQVGYGRHRWGPLRRGYLSAVFELTNAIRKARTDPDRALRFRAEGQEFADSAGPFAGAWAMARAMLAAAKEAKPTIWHTTVRVQLAVRSGEVREMVVPAAAAKTAATKATLAFHEEVSLVFGGAKTLGVFVPRVVAGTSSWSEHAWAAAEDWGVAKGDGYETNPTRIALVLDDVHLYVLANSERLGVERHIYDGHVWWANEGRLDRDRYLGSDQHDTHTHTQFADHGGRKPPWVS